VRGRIWVWDDLPTHLNERFDLGKVVIDDLGMLVLKVVGKLGDVVHLYLIPQTRLFLDTLECGQIELWVGRGKEGYAHSPAGRNVSVELSLVEPLDGVLLFLLEWEMVKFMSDCKLAIDMFLGDVEVFDVEKTSLVNGGDEGVGELLLAYRGGVEGEVDGDQVGPVEVGLKVKGFGIGFCESERGLLTFVSWTYW